MYTILILSSLQDSSMYTLKTVILGVWPQAKQNCTYWNARNELSVVEKSCYSVFVCGVSAASAYTITLGKVNFNHVNYTKYLGIIIYSDCHGKVTLTICS